MKVVIPSYGNPIKAVFCAEQVRRTWPGSIYIVDDTGVPDPDMFESAKRSWLALTQHITDVSVFILAQNLGFSGAVNIGISSADEDVVLVNSDVVVSNDAIFAMEEAAQRWRQAGIIGAKLFYPSGDVQHAGMVGPNQFGGFWHVGKDTALPVPEQETDEYPCVTGALMFVRFQAWEEVGGFDQDYRNNAEDVDFCWAVRQAGWRVVYSPLVKAVHLERATLGYSHQAAQCAQHGLNRFHEKWSTQETK